MWIIKEEIEELIKEKVRELTEKKLREAVSNITKEWDTKREELLEEVGDLKIQIAHDDQIKEELHKYNAPIEIILSQVDWCKDVSNDTARKARDLIQCDLGRTNIPETYSYESEPLEAGVYYKVSKDSYVGVVGLKFLDGAGYFETIFGDKKKKWFIEKKFAVANGEQYKIFEMGVVLPSATKFILKPLTKESKLKYTLIGSGFNNPKIEEVQ